MHGPQASKSHSQVEVAVIKKKTGMSFHSCHEEKGSCGVIQFQGAQHSSM
jgi:hypothetical protein